MQMSLHSLSSFIAPLLLRSSRLFPPIWLFLLFDDVAFRTTRKKRRKKTILFYGKVGKDAFLLCKSLVVNPKSQWAWSIFLLSSFLSKTFFPTSPFSEFLFRVNFRPFSLFKDVLCQSSRMSGFPKKKKLKKGEKFRFFCVWETAACLSFLDPSGLFMLWLPDCEPRDTVTVNPFSFFLPFFALIK